MRPSRDALLALGLFLILAVLTIAAAFQQSREITLPPLANNSTAPNGGNALWLWLGRINYFVRDTVQMEFEIPETASAVLILEPQILMTDAEWEVLDTFVEEGGTLLLAGEGIVTARAMQHYNFDFFYSVNEARTLAPFVPLISAPPLASDTAQAADEETSVPGAALQANTFLFPDFPEDQTTSFTPLFALPEGPVIVTFQQGEGRVILSADVTPFTNAGLKEPGNAELVLNLIGTVPRNNTLWFDEWHHGKRLEAVTPPVSGPGDWLRYTPAGRALLYVAGVIFLGLVLGGRQFGRPIPLSHEISRRAPLEYVTAIANLNRRAGNRTSLLRHYHSQLKRTLGRRYRLDPTLRDGEFVTRLAQYDTTLDTNALRTLLTQLTRKNVSEAEMVEIARETSEWIKEG